MKKENYRFKFDSIKKNATITNESGRVVMNMSSNTVINDWVFVMQESINEYKKEDFHIENGSSFFPLIDVYSGDNYKTIKTQFVNSYAVSYEIAPLLNGLPITSLKGLNEWCKKYIDKKWIEVKECPLKNQTFDWGTVQVIPLYKKDEAVNKITIKEIMFIKIILKNHT